VRAARGVARRGRARGATSRSGKILLRLPLFELVFLQNFELKCNMWSAGKL
jgi:hypothetical protein